MKPLIIIAVIILILYFWLKPKKKDETSDNEEITPKNTAQKYEGELNDHMKSVIIHPATQGINIAIHKGEELHQLARKNKRKRPGR